MYKTDNSGNRKGMSPLAVKLAKITVVVIFFCFAECAAGSCLSYGHACWGAHGKRSGAPSREEAPTVDLVPKWFLSRLAAPSPSRFSDKDLADAQQFVELMDVALKTPEEYRSMQEMNNEDDSNRFYDEIAARQRAHSRKIRAVKPIQQKRGSMI